MEQLKLTAYKDESFSSKEGETLSLPVVVEQLTFDKRITYVKDRQLGSIGGGAKYQQYEPKRLSLKFTIDTTGVVEGTRKGDKAYDKVQEIEKVLYNYKTEAHRPAYVVLCYAQIMFKGQLARMDVNYTLFTVDGIPLRAEVSLEFKGYMCGEEERKKFSKQSPDMSRLITVKEGETLPYLCYRMYGDSQLVRQVARFNNLNGFRDIPAGTELLFPPLKKT